MPDKEAELEKEWRQAVSSKLNSIEDSLHGVEVALAEIGAAKVVARVEELEKIVSGLQNFRIKVVTAVVVAQALIGVVFAVAKFMT